MVLWRVVRFAKTRTYTFTVIVLVTVLVYTRMLRASYEPLSAIFSTKLHVFSGSSRSQVVGPVAAVVYEQLMTATRYTQNERQQRRDLVCADSRQRSNRAARVSLAGTWSIVDDKHKVIYCYVPKAACTTWKNTLAELTGIPPHPDDDVHNQTTLQRYGFRVLNSVPLAEAKELLDKYKKFMFVRHPLSRLYSAYRDKFMGYAAFRHKYKDRYAQEIILRFRPQSSKTEAREGRVTFKEFVQYIIYKWQHGGMLNQHWRSQVDLCAPCAIKYNFIGKVETLDTDSMYILRDYFGQEWSHGLPLSHSKGDFDVREVYGNITSEEIDSLIKVFELDFAVFGYSTGLP